MGIRRLVGKRFNTKTRKRRVVKHPLFSRLIHQYFARSMMFVGHKVFYYISDNYGYYSSRSIFIASPPNVILHFGCYYLNDVQFHLPDYLISLSLLLVPLGEKDYNIIDL